MGAPAINRPAYDFNIAPGVWGKKDLFVNYYIIQDRQSDAWFLVDAGMKWSAPRIKAMAAELFGKDSRPAGIILTHGHFDHVGALPALLKEWNVPVYAHYLEMPYLTGKSSYPPADPTVGGGMMSTISWMYPTSPIDIAQNLQMLPDDNTIPGLTEWKYLHTPGHAPGHISLFRETDKVLIAGDAIVTTQQESAISALTYRHKLSGPPKYFTCNWASAKISALKLAALNPEIIGAGHGDPLQGEEMRNALHTLSNKFDQLAVPKNGRYINEPAITDDTGVVYLPPIQQAQHAPLFKAIGLSLGVLAVGYLFYRLTRRNAPVGFLGNVRNIAKKAVIDKKALAQLMYN